MNPNSNSHHHCYSGHASWVHLVFRLITPVEETCLTRRQVLVYEPIPCAFDPQKSSCRKFTLASYHLCSQGHAGSCTSLFLKIPTRTTSIRWGHMGNNAAATIANQMRSTFPATRFGLMMARAGRQAGRCRRFQANKNDDGVIQYAFSRTVGEGRFVRNSTGKKR
ncbi:hypothetical protein CGRA01v4_12783 [Colletotrichum graminicola]|nr:hypothetical protein CGRA01v4_12783 [Colletotrichum graminicola]